MASRTSKAIGKKVLKDGSIALIFDDKNTIQLNEEELRGCIDNVLEEAEREERALTPNEKADVADLYDQLDKVLGYYHD